MRICGKSPQAGEYTVTVDTEQRTILFTLERRFYTSLAMVGPATPGDWAITEATPLTRSGRVFTWEGDLKVGTLRFACDPDGTWETDQYIASERDKPVVPGVSEELVLAARVGAEPRRLHVEDRRSGNLGRLGRYGGGNGRVHPQTEPAGELHGDAHGG